MPNDSAYCPATDVNREQHIEGAKALCWPRRAIPMVTAAVFVNVFIPQYILINMNTNIRCSINLIQGAALQFHRAICIDHFPPWLYNHKICFLNIYCDFIRITPLGYRQ